MELSEELFNQIHAYLGEEGTVEERSVFEQQMKQNPALAQEVATQRRIKSGLKANQYKRQFESIHAQLKAEGSLPVVATTIRKEENREEVLSGTPTRTLWRYVAAAASIMLMIGVGWFIYSGSDTSTQEIVAQDKELKNTPATPSESKPTNAESEPSNSSAASTPPATTPNAPDTEQLFAEAFDPEPGITKPFSNDNLGVSPGSVARWQADTAALYGGVRLLQAGQATSARTYFERAEISTNQEIREQAQWYMALALLREGERAKSRQRLEQIASDEKHPYQNRAKRIVRKLANK